MSENENTNQGEPQLKTSKAKWGRATMVAPKKKEHRNTNFMAAVVGASLVNESQLPSGVSPYLEIERDLLNSLAKHEKSSVTLTGQKLNDAALRVLTYAIQRSMSVSVINMADTGLTNDSITLFKTIIAESKSLCTLDLSNNMIGDHGMMSLRDAFASNTNLDHLYLQFNQIGWKGAMTISNAIQTGNKRILSIDLSNNPIGDLGATHIARALWETKDQSMLETLRLNNCGIGDPGCAALAHALSQCPNFKVLHVNDNQFGAKGSRMLENAMGGQGGVTGGVSDIIQPGDETPEKVVVMMRTSMPPEERLPHIPAPSSSTEDEPPKADGKPGAQS